ncbi:Retrovirus-related Pol polyprotein from transposon TNT 1-94 [Linum grandiflorum]
MKNVPYASAVGSLMYAMVCTRPDIAHAFGVVSRFLSNPGKEHWVAVKWILCYLRGAAVSWQSRLQKCVALLTTEAEYIAMTEDCKEVIWLKKFLQELGIKQERYVLYCDSQSAIHLCKNPTFHSRSKHIDVRYHWIRDALEEKLLELDKVHTDDNGSDMMTKSLPSEKLVFCRKEAGLVLPTI